MGTIRIRTARQDEVAFVLELWRTGQPTPSATDDPEAVLGLLDRDAGALLVAESDGRLVGTVIVGWDGWRAGFYRLVVVPQMRRAGIASLLVRAGEDRLRELGVRRVAAVVMLDHEHAKGFWEAMGYHPIDRVGRYVKDLPG